MAGELRRSEQRAGLPSREIPAAPRSRWRGHRRGPELQDPAAQLQRADRREHRGAEGQAPAPGARLPHGRHDGRRGLRAGPARRAHPRACTYPQGGQQDTGDHRGALRHHHQQPDRQHHQGQREGQDQGPAHRGQHGRERGDRDPPGQRREPGQHHRRALRLHGLRAQHRAERLRDRERQAPLRQRHRAAGDEHEEHARTAQAGTADQAGGARTTMALQFAGAHLHREEGLPQDRGGRDLGGGDRVHQEGPQAAHRRAAPARDRGGYPATDGDPHQAHQQVRWLPGR